MRSWGNSGPLGGGVNGEMGGDGELPIQNSKSKLKNQVGLLPGSKPAKLAQGVPLALAIGNTSMQHVPKPFVMLLQL